MDNKEQEAKFQKYIDEAISFRHSQRDNEYITNRAHYEGLHWNLAENKTDSPFLLKSDINHLKYAVDLRLGSLFSDKYYGDLKPLSPNDVDNVETLNVIYKNEWNRLQLDGIIENIIKNGAICDNGYLQVTYNPDKIIGGTNTRGEGAIEVIPLETENVYLDPSASCLEDCSYIVVKSEKSKKWISLNRPKWLERFRELGIKEGGVSTGDNGEILTGRDYGKKNANSYELSTLYIKETVPIEVKQVNDVGETILETINKIQVKEYVLVGGHIIDENNKYPFEDFPIVTFQWEPIPQSPYGIPLLRGLTTPQKVANLIESAANNIAMHYTVPTWLVAEDSGIDIDDFSKLSNALGMAWLVSGDPTRAVKQMDPPQINKDLIGIKDSFVQNIRTYAGVTDTYIGNIGTAGSTAEGTNMAVNRATIIDNSPIKQIEKFVESLSRLLIKFIARYYKDRTIYVRDTQQFKKDYNWKEYTVEGTLSSLNYDFYVDLASRNKSDKNRQYNLMKELYTIQNQYKDPTKVINVTDLVKAAQLDNYNELFKRFSDMSEDAFREKLDLITQVMMIGQTMTPNGEPLITAEEMQEGLLDILNDDGSLQVVDNIFKTYEEYQKQVTELKYAYDQQENQALIDEIQTESNDLENTMKSNMQSLMQTDKEEV